MSEILVSLIFIFVSSSVFAKTNGLSRAGEKNSVSPKLEFQKTASLAESKTVTVHGMVCAFCSSSLEKKFKKEQAVEKIKVDLKNQKVIVHFKKGLSMDDKKIKKMITASGFKVVSIKESFNKDIKENMEKNIKENIEENIMTNKKSSAPEGNK